MTIRKDETVSAKKTVWICAERHWYGPRRTREPLLTESGRVWTGTCQAARERIAEMESESYETAHGESGAPSYRIRYDRPEYLANWGGIPKLRSS